MQKMIAKYFEKWEAVNRNTMGDEAFLKKYIKAFSKSDKPFKIMLPIFLVTYLACALVVISETKGNLLLPIVYFGTTLPSLPLTIYVCCCLVKLQKRRVEEWKKELAEYER